MFVPCVQCRYTLKYTYPYAYYMEAGPRKTLVGCMGVCTVHAQCAEILLFPPPSLPPSPHTLV